MSEANGLPVTPVAGPEGPSSVPSVSPPPLGLTLASLLRADFTSQARNRRAWVLSVALPLILLFALFAGNGKDRLGDPSVRVASCLTLGIASIAVLAYSLSVARDRELGVFQRLRVAPAPSWAIMCSRLVVQVASILAMAVVLLVTAAIFVSVRLSAGAYVLTLVVVVVSSAEFLGIGQALVGLIKSPDTVNAVGRLLYIPLFALGVFGHTTIFGRPFELISRWSPAGAVAALLSGAMHPATWSFQTWFALLASLAYAVVFAGLGIRWFQWTSR